VKIPTDLAAVRAKSRSANGHGGRRREEKEVSYACWGFHNGVVIIVKIISWRG